MNHSNNHFQKGIVILVVTMLLAIPNMRVYSAIGGYQSSSTAIMANNFYKHSCLTKNIRPVSLAASIVFAFAIAGSVAGAALLGAGVGSIGTVVAMKAAGIGTFSLGSKNLDAHYAKHDFSQFDNYTPSNMKPARFVNTLKK